MILLKILRTVFTSDLFGQVALNSPSKWANFMPDMKPLDMGKSGKNDCMIKW